jgi:ATP-dependent Clp protease ATP-binding subunit ClpC
MFERFTGPAREAVVIAQEEARDLRHGYIGTEHLLLGLLRESGGAGSRRRRAGRCDPVATPFAGRVPFTPRAKKVLELSVREALHLGHKYIGTEHILLGIVREGEGLAAQVLAARGAAGPLVRDVVSEEIRRGGDSLP